MCCHVIYAMDMTRLIMNVLHMCKTLRDLLLLLMLSCLTDEQAA